MPKHSHGAPIGVYHPHSEAGTVASGAEYVVVALAQSLSSRGAVELIHHKPDLDHKSIQANYDIDLTHVHLRFLPRPTEVPFGRPVGRYRAERRFAGFTRNYRLFVASAHELPPFCFAERGALYVHFPRFHRDGSWPWARGTGGPRSWLRRAYAHWEWRERFAGYQLAMVNSAFTARYAREWWGVSPVIVHPPSREGIPAGEAKRNLIISLGRFTTIGTSKNQLELMHAFQDLGGGEAWEYHSVGGVGKDPRDLEYFEQVKALGEGTSAVVRANLSRQELDTLLGQARVFWHGAGLTADLSNPLLLEHFGIVTVEAMSAGCVPVVIARGGQPEIVEHGVSGFLWHTPDELKQYTLRLIQEPELLARMSSAARARAARFSRAAFAGRIVEALTPLLSE